MNVKFICFAAVMVLTLSPSAADQEEINTSCILISGDVKDEKTETKSHTKPSEYSNERHDKLMKVIENDPMCVSISNDCHLCQVMKDGWSCDMSADDNCKPSEWFCVESSEERRQRMLDLRRDSLITYKQ